MTNENINITAAEIEALIALKAQIAQMEKAQKAIEEKIKTAIKASGENSIEVGVHTCTLTDYTQERINSKKLKAKDPEVWNAFKMEVTCQRLTVK